MRDIDIERDIHTHTHIYINIYARIYTPVLLKTKGRLDEETFNLSFHQPPKINPDPELRRRSRTGLSAQTRPPLPRCREHGRSRPGGAAAIAFHPRTFHAQGWVTSLLASCQRFLFSKCYSLEHAVPKRSMEQGRMLFLEERSYSTGEEQVLGSRTIQKWP